MKIVLNQFYIKQIEAIYNHAHNSKGGMKKILPPLKGENESIVCYERTTYPDYLRIFFVKTHKNYLGEYPYEDGYYNGSRRELLRFINNLLLGKINTKRLQYFSKDLFYLWYYYVRNFEQEFNEKYFTWNEEDFEEIPI